MNHYLGASLRSLRRQKTLTLLTVAAIALSVALVAVLVALGDALDRARIDQAESLAGSFHVEFKNIKPADANALMKDKDVQKLGVGQILGNARIPGENFTLNLERFDKNSFALLGVKLLQGRLPESSSEILLDEQTADKLGIDFAAGKPVTLSLEASRLAADGSLRNKKVQDTVYTLVGIMRNHPATVAGRYGMGFTGLDSSSPEETVNVFVRFQDGVNPQAAAGMWREQLKLQEWQTNDNDMLLSAMGYQGDDNGSGGDLTRASLLIGGLVLLAACLVIYNIFQVSIVQRTRQFGMLRAVGAAPSQVRRSVLSEALLLCTAGIPAGLLIGILSSGAVTRAVAANINPDTLGVESAAQTIDVLQNHLRFPWTAAVLAAAVGLAATLVSVWMPARAASRVPPVIALSGFNGESVVKIRRRARTRAIGRFFLWETARLNLKRNRRRTVVTVVSLAMSATMFVALQSFVLSFNTTDMLTENMDSAFSLSAESPIAVKDIASIRSMPGVERVRTARVYKPPYDLKAHKAANIQNKAESSAWLLAHTFEAIGYDDETLRLLLARAGVQSPSLQEMRKQSLALVWNNDVNQRFDPNWKPPEPGTRVSFGNAAVDIAGVSDIIGIHRYFTPLGTTLLMHEDQVKAISPESGITYADVFVKSGMTPGQREALEKLLASIKKDTPGSTLTSLEEAKTEVEQSLAGIRSIGYGLIALITIIGALGIINTTLTGLHTRRVEFGTLQAIGMSGVQMSVMIVLESLHYGFRALLIGLPAGIGLSAFIMTVTRGIEYWSPPVVESLLAALCALALCLLSALPPLARMRRTSIVQSISDVD
ncbi:ABC transporter permease [Paenibacillus durus]|uniref:ABC3 transporter permease protein domain-containing protein n=1 Tax=Paenibacillus durus TaxID=44251 RepID=A0A089INL6_PAEDU|nr:ABC transporter permease [Paenibacillus durus]AIQ10689.1 hypothetical protein PDUR_00525 [Paenibacillus durus]